MKVFLFLAVLFISHCLQAQDYQPLLTDGKMWNWVSANYFSMQKRNFTVAVVGDTIVDNLNCRRLCLFYEGDPEKYYYPAYEENGKLFFYLNVGGAASLLLDFSLHLGEKAAIGENYYVLKEDTVEVKGYLRRRLALGREDEGIGGYWVEGVGSDRDVWATLIDKHIGDYHYMVSCYENGTCIFEADDFNASPTNILNIPLRSTDNVYYDLGGNVIFPPIERSGIYIKDGRKFIHR